MKLIVTIFGGSITSINSLDSDLTINNGGQTRVEVGEKDDIRSRITDIVDNIELLDNYVDTESVN